MYMVTIMKHKFIKILNMANAAKFLKVKSANFFKFGLFCLVAFSFACLLLF